MQLYKHHESYQSVSMAQNLKVLTATFEISESYHFTQIIKRVTKAATED